MKKLTKKQFEEGYASRSGVTVAWLKENGREARPCHCGEEGCQGWQMAHVKEDERFKAWMKSREVKA